jgi:membrane protease YdiL (CAAX protease family)
MTDESFSHLIFWNHPLNTVCFFAFAMSFLSLWVRKTPWLWGSFLAIATIIAFQANIISPIALIPMGILLFCHYFLKSELPVRMRFLFFCTATLISCALIFHFLPGFHNWNIASASRLSPTAYPYRLWFNFDKPLIGIFPLAFTIPLIQTRASLVNMLKVAIPMSVLAIALLLGGALYANMVRWDPKIPTLVFPWIIANLFFVTIPEEAFFRGFVQKQLYKWFGEGPGPAFGAIAFTSLLFTLLHWGFAPSFSALFLIFIASMIYGTTYQMTKSIEASIICHFGVNLVHFFLFTYPGLSS